MRPTLVTFLISAAILGFSSPVSAQTGSKKEHTFRGRVEKVDPGTRTLTVNGENVPGWMASMTMTYRVDKPDGIKVKPGDYITATVYDGDFTTLHDVRPAPKPAAANDLPALSYVCPSPGEEGVLEDKPGKCPQSGALLVPVRIVTAYSCLKVESFIQEKEGTCPVDHSKLVPITASFYFSCQSDAKIRELEPGICADGNPRIKRFERRSHGDHNPRHGGQFFMADDNWHHLEGTFVRPNLFRVYFYDDFTRPLVPAGFLASISKIDAYGKDVTAPVAVKPGRTKDRNTLEVAIPGATFPASFALHIKFKPDDKERVFDFTFPEYSKEPVPGVPSPVAPVSAAPVPPNDSGSDAAVPSYPYSSGGSGAPVNREEALPATTPELLAELAKRAQSVTALLDKGDLGGLWYPAIGAKDVALALEENHINELPEAQRERMASAVRRLTLAAWQIDAAGDLGNKERLLPLVRDFSAAIGEIQAVYGNK